jgi:hypothetical protein
MPTPSDPTAGPTGQSSSKMSGDPKELLEETRAGIESHADLVEAYGYTMPIATLGSHPWLRDRLANSSQKEPGAAAPNYPLNNPAREKR